MRRRAWPPHLRDPGARALLATFDPGPEGDARIRAALHEPDGRERFLAVWQRERAGVPTMRRVLAAAGDVLPGEIRRAWQQLALVHEFRDRQVEADLHRALGVLSGASAPVVLLKGAAIAVHYVGSFVERPMIDVDLLASDETSGIVWQRLRDAGWVWDEGEYPGVWYERHLHLPPLRAPGAMGTLIEVHRKLYIEGSPLEALREELKSRLRPAGDAWPEVFVPDPTWMLVHVAGHFMWSHAAGRGLWRTLCDVKALASSSVDWQEVADLAEQTHAGGCLYWTLRIAHHLAGVDVPRSVLSRLQPAWREPLLPALERHLLRRAIVPEETVTSVKLGRLLWGLSMPTELARPNTVKPWHFDEVFRTG